jgi:hypothetical protein
VKEFERKQLVERIDRDGATVGVRIPDRVEVQGEEVELRDFVFEIKRRDAIPPGERDRVERAKRNLRRERLERREVIEAGEVSFAEGERVADTIVGIDRALEALESLDSSSIEREAEAQETADTKRWMSFLKQALGQEDVSSRGL